MKQEVRIFQPRLRNGFSWLLIGNLGYAATQYLILVGLVKLTKPEIVGSFSFALAVNAPVNLMMSLGLRSVLVSDAEQRHSFAHYWGLRVLTALASILVVFIITRVGNFSYVLSRTIVIVSFVKGLESCIDMGYGLWQKHHRNHQIAFSMLLRGALSSLIFNLLIWKTGELDFACCGLLVSTLLMACVYDFPRWKTWTENTFSFKIKKQRGDFIAYRGLLFLSLPLGIAAILSSLESNLPRYLIEHSLDLRALGLFSALSYPLMLGNQVIGAMAAAPAPQLAQMTVHNDFRGFKKLLFQLSLGGALIGGLSYIICLIWGREILTLINNPEYAKESMAFSILAASAAFSYVTAFFGAGLSALREFRTKMILQGLGFAVTFVALAAVSGKVSLGTISAALLMSAAGSCLMQLAALVYHVKKWKAKVARL